MENLKEEFGLNVYNSRKDNGLTQVDLAVAIDMT